MLEIAIFTIALIISYAGVAAFRRWSEKQGIIDLPNDRSSHITPTPRGGGVVIAAVCLAGYFLAAHLAGSRVSWGYIVGSLVIVGISWLDDIRSVSSFVRLICHTAAALIFVADSGVISSFEVPGLSGSVNFGWLAPVLTVLWIVWLINAYNFMDGIDGIAGTQALVAGIGWSFAAFAGSAPAIYYFGIIIAAASLGFLVHNWQPAKIFMGDAGSAFLGFTFAVLPILASSENPNSSGRFALTAVIVVWFFVFDSVLTFLVRLLTGQRVWTPHREHLYQRLVRSGRSHAFVSLIYGLLTAVLIVVFTLAMKIGGNTGVLLFIMVVLSVGLTIYVRQKKYIDVTS